MGSIARRRPGYTFQKHVGKNKRRQALRRALWVLHLGHLSA
jgi:hypothetical protein